MGGSALLLVLAGGSIAQRRMQAHGVVQAINGTPILRSRESFAIDGIPGLIGKSGFIEAASAEIK
jgi:hypothetical protein